MSLSVIDPDLLALYAGTDYQVHAKPGFTLHIDQASTALHTLLQRSGQGSATFITAWNPRSEPLGEAENAQRMAALRARLGPLGLPVLEAHGHDPSGQCAGEASLLVLGLTLAQAEDLGRDFGQNAILWAGPDAVPRLLLLR